MHIKFNSLNQYEPPVISLCNPGSKYEASTKVPTKIIGVLSDISDDELVLNFNTTSELNFRAYKINHRPDSDLSNESETKESVALFDKIQNRRLLFVKDIGYFVIDDITYGFDTSGEYKDIKASSVESELRGKKIPYIEDNTYSFESLLSKIVPIHSGDISIPDDPLIWTVDSSIPQSLSKKYRTFEEVDVEKDRLTFLTEDMQEAYECIFEFDIIYRVIHVYDQADYVQPTDIHLTKNDLINSISVTENSDDLYTALSVLGNDNETISSINPLGSNVIYDFTYYLPWMSEGLRERVVEWQKLVKDNEQAYYDASLAYFKEADIVADYDLEIERLESLKATYEKCITSKTGTWLKQLNEELESVGSALKNAFKELSSKLGKALLRNYYACDEESETFGYDFSSYSTYDDGTYNPENKNEIIQKVASFTADGSISESTDLFSEANVEALDFDAYIKSKQVQKDINDAKAEQAVHKSLMNGYKSKMDDIHNKVKITNYFGDYIDELSFFIFEGNYKDDYVVITDQMSQEEIFEQLQTMLDRARLTLSKTSYPTQEFSVDVGNFFFEKEFKPWSNQLETGRAINVEVEDGDTAQLFLTNITVNYQDQTLSLTFGNRLDRFDAKSIFEKVLGGISRSSNSISFIKDTMYPIKNGELDVVKKAIETARNLSINNALFATDEEVVIDGSGYLGRKKNSDGTFDDKQIKITGRNILFTKDNWKTCSTAIGEIFIDTSQSKTAYGVNAEYLIGEVIFGQSLTIRNNDSSIKIDENGLAISCLTDQSGVFQTPFKISKTGADSKIEDLLWTDTSGDLHIKGKITATDLELTGSATIGTGDIEGLEDYVKNNAPSADLTGYIKTDGEIGTGTFSDDNGTATAFTVSGEGLLKAKNAIIYGSIYASGGTIGGFTLSKGQMLYSTVESTNGFLVCPGGTTSYHTIANKYQSGWAMAIGSKFGVSNSGILYAKDAVISGEIEASKFKLTDGATITGYATTSDVTEAKNTAATAQATANSAQSTANSASATAASASSTASTASTNANNAKTLIDALSGKALVKDGTTQLTNGFILKNSGGENIFYMSDDGETAIFKGTIYAGGGEFTGKVTATSGSIGGFLLSSNHLIGNGFLLYSEPSGSVDVTVLGKKVTIPQPNMIMGTTFAVADGIVLAGGWQFGKNSHYGNDDVIYRTDDDLEVGIKCTPKDSNGNANDTNATFYIAKKQSNGTYETRFHVSNIGKIYSYGGYLEGKNGTMQICATNGVSIIMSKGVTTVKNNVNTWSTSANIEFCLPTSANSTAQRKILSLYSVGSGDATGSVLRYKDLYSYTGVSSKNKKIVYVDEDGRFCVAS